MDRTEHFEDLALAVSRLRPAENDSEREIVWCDEARARVGFSRTERGQMELVIAGPMLSSGSSRISSRLSYDRWDSPEGDKVELNRILLPAASMFDRISAFLVVELLRHGADVDPSRGFAAVEPQIELVLERAPLTDGTVLGLMGELLVVQGLLARAPQSTARILHSWHGYEHSSRDFQLPSTGVEIKATTSLVSRHSVSGVHQVEAGRSVDGSAETSLFLVSVGLEWMSEPDEESVSLSALVEDVAQQMDVTGHRAEFLERIAAYGADSGYVHKLMQHSSHYNRPMRLRFMRLYDLLDPEISLLRSPDVVDFKHLVHSSVSYQVDFPARLSEGNPVEGRDAVLQLLADRAGLSY